MTMNFLDEYESGKISYYNKIIHSTGEMFLIIFDNEKAVTIKINKKCTDISEYMDLFTREGKKTNTRPFKREQLKQYLDENILRMMECSRKYIPFSDFEFTTLIKNDKIKLLKMYGYVVDDDKVIACKAVNGDYSGMLGYPKYDTVGQIYGGEYDISITKSNGKYAYEEYHSIKDYSRSSHDDHCRGLWSSTKYYVYNLIKRNVDSGKGYSKCIEVEYDLNDPNLVLNVYGHLRSLKLKIHKLYPKWKYDIMTIGKSFVYN